MPSNFGCSEPILNNIYFVLRIWHTFLSQFLQLMVLQWNRSFLLYFAISSALNWPFFTLPFVRDISSFFAWLTNFVQWRFSLNEILDSLEQNCPKKFLYQKRIMIMRLTKSSRSIIVTRKNTLCLVLFKKKTL